MGKIRVQDLARMMGVSNQDLVFKLKSIGVRVEGDDAHIDTDIIQAILQGKKLPHPREVILRDQEEAQEASPAAARRRGPRRPPVNPLRPSRPRSLIQRVESKIKTIPTTARPEDKKKEQEEAAAREAEARKAAEEKAAIEAAAKKAAEEKAAAEAAAEAAAAAAPVVERAETAEAPTEEDEEKTAAERAAAREAERARRAEREEQEREKKKTKGAKKARTTEEDEDLAAYKGAIEELEPEELGTDEARAPVSTRRKRRVERKKEKQKATEEGGTLLSFDRGRPEAPVMITEGMTVRDFAEKLGVKSKDLLKAMFERGIMANINQVVEPELAEKLAQDLGVEAMVVSFEEEVQFKEELELGQEEGEATAPRAPVVTVMGHVDHGKTSLLDAIRETRVAEDEAGGITQHIGAYKVTAGDRDIVFLDTPGHEAFTMMRARGAQATDLVVLVVAADDGVMPQTVEAIDHARAARVPIVVAINKMDKANANPDRVKKELADHELLVEDWGGDVVAVPMSALKGEGIDELLEMILLTADLLELKANPEISAHGVVVEAKKEVGRGTVATVLVQNGTLAVGDVFVCGATWGRVRSMMDDRGERLKDAGPSTPVSVSGFQDVPAAGDTLQVVESEAKARSIAEYRSQEKRSRDLAPTVGKVSLESLFDQMEAGEVKELPVVLKADVQGSVEVVRDSLEKLSTDKVKVQVIHAAVGAISTNDVILASASNAIVLGFNVRPERNAADMAEKEKVDIRLHTVIYELMDELKAAMTGLLEPTFQEVTRGRAEVRETFKVPKAGVVAGCHVVDGVVPRNAQARLLRDNRVIYEGRIESLRRFKDDVAEVRQGFDCGISLERFQDIKPGDEIEAFVKEEVAPEL
jgi:translation initiation factor IF-2